jgi:hypothetical protein
MGVVAANLVKLGCLIHFAQWSSVVPKVVSAW